MDILGTLPVWVQLVIAVLVAGVLVVMNVGWLIQARGWLEQQRRRGATTPGRAPARATSPTTRQDRR